MTDDQDKLRQEMEKDLKMEDLSIEDLGRDDIRMLVRRLEERVQKRTATLTAINERLQQEVTDRRNTEELLRATLEAAENVGFVMIRLLESGDRIVEFNPGAEKIFGYSRKEVLDQPISRLQSPECIARFPVIVERLRQKRSGSTSELNLLRKSGDQFPAIFSAYPIFNDKNEMIAILEVVIDITEQKKAEEKLLQYQDQLRSLSSQLVLTEERERQYIATELHDRIGQSLALSKIKLAQLRTKLDTPDTTALLDSIRELMDETIQDTRSLSFELSPPVLHKLGLEAAIEWLAEQFQERYRIHIVFECDQNDTRLTDDVSVLLFRAVRELVLNIVKHADASRIFILFRKDNHIRIIIQDDGVGFNVTETESDVNRNAGFGLFSIRERLRNLGGYLQLNSRPDEGTVAILVMPLHREKGRSDIA